MRSVVQLIRRVTGGRIDPLLRFCVEDRGQDLVEYAFLAAFIGITSYVALNGIVAAVGDVYASWIDPSVGVPSAWEPPEPPAGGGS